MPLTTKLAASPVILPTRPPPRAMKQLGLLTRVERNQQAGNAYLAHLPVDRLNQFWRQVGIGDQGEVIGM
jgi:hypothetical protein